MPYLSSIQRRNLQGAAIVILLHAWFKGDFFGSLSLPLAVCLSTDGRVVGGQNKLSLIGGIVNVAVKAS